MRPQKIEDNELLSGLMNVLRSKGYDGASLNELAQSSGLKKASLYHRFPGGKQEITQAVLAYVDTWLDIHIAKVASDRSLPARERLGTLVRNIAVLYDDGKVPCILRALSLGSGMELFSGQLEHSMGKWIAAFTLLALDFGKTEQEASDIGVKVVILVQGSLIVARTMKDTHYFQNALASVIKLYQV